MSLNPGNQALRQLDAVKTKNEIDLCYSEKHHLCSEFYFS
ncbi:hypothetical protein FDUTEX481_00292 [Tolypothrix sp. PCC 7601]|nr:hypothetical protein FDUTEX481_00292 [Tolypothrix sp. PCC 7601]